jgi:hypothetical protein
MSAATATAGVPPDAKKDRKRFVNYVINRADVWHREHMGRLYTAWAGWNARHFDNALVVPYLLMTAPGSPRAYGDYGRLSCWGGHGQTRIREKLLTGAHPHMRPGDQYAEGRYLFVADVFLHESVHQWQHEVLNNLEPGYKGHGPLFAGRCNEIGAVLGLPRVRPAKVRGKDKDLPSCAQWPHNVRPEGYYLGAYLPPGKKDPEGEGEGEGEEEPPATLAAALAALIEAALHLGGLLPGELLGPLEKLHRDKGWPAPPGQETRSLLLVTAAATFLDHRDGRSHERPGGGGVIVPVPGVSGNGDPQELVRKVKQLAALPAPAVLGGRS